MYTTAVSETALSQSDAKTKVLAVNEGITLRVHMTYNDIYGTPYETDICETRLLSGAPKACPGNKIK